MEQNDNGLDDRRTERKGVALAVALMAIVLIGLLIAGSFYASTQEFRVGANGMTQTAASAASDYGLNWTIDNWDNSRNLRLTPGDTEVLKFAVAPGVVDTVVITKLNRYTFLAASQARAGTGAARDARRRSGLILRLAYPVVAYTGALTAAGPVNVTGTAVISGQNQDPNWNAGANACIFNGTDYPAVTTPDVTTVTVVPPASVNTGSGAPIVANPAAGTPATYNAFGSESWASLRTSSNVVLPAGSVVSPAPWMPGGTCKLANTNWGDVNHTGTAATPCETYFPVVYAAGDLTVGNGSGQGMLLVEGNLTITGNFTFIGIVIVHGFVTATGTGSDINGALLIGGVPPTPPGVSSIGGSLTVRKSTCATEYATRGGAVVVRAKERPWQDMY